MNDQVRVTSNRFGSGEVWVEATEAFGWVEVKPEYLMQSTGLKDKNGVEIFEGDIVHYQSVSMSKKDWYKKVARRGSALVMMSFDERLIDSAEYFNLMTIDERIEVIGNIYENPELLEVEE